MASAPREQNLRYNGVAALREQDLGNKGMVAAAA